jgi:endoglucanase
MIAPGHPRRYTLAMRVAGLMSVLLPALCACDERAGSRPVVAPSAKPATAPPGHPAGSLAPLSQGITLAARPAGGLSVRVSGNKFVDGKGAPLRLRGANHSGTEFACVQGWGLFSGPGDESVFAGMETWKMNVVRIPLNEDCWLGINGVDAAHGGTVYRDAITNWVSLAHQHGLITILDLHWVPGAAQ